MGYFLKFFFATSLFCSVSFGAKHNIFGPDARQQVTSNEYPWSTVGYLSSGCTATLIDKNLIVTAAHCVYDDSGQIQALTYYPNMIGNQSNTSSYATYTWTGTSDPKNDRAHDWAIVQLNDDLGSSYGSMGVKEQDADTVTLAGYSYDFMSGQTAGAHVNCTIQERLTDFWLHDCDGTRGSSGGPMFVSEGNNEAYIVALMVAEYRGDGEDSLQVSEYSKEYANIAIPSERFLPTLNKILGN